MALERVLFILIAVTEKDGRPADLKELDGITSTYTIRSFIHYSCISAGVTGKSLVSCM